jgi:hypothetical protein
MRRLWVLLLVVAIGAAGCSGNRAVSAITRMPTPTPTASPSDAPTPVPTAIPTVQPTPIPTIAQPQTYAVDEPIVMVDDNGGPWGIITISDVQIAKSYKGSYGFVEKPETAGDVYIAARVTYEAHRDGIPYNPYNWQVFVDGSAVSSHAFVIYGPKPELGSGTLPNGRKASGYVVYEVPATGEVRMSYGSGFSSDAPIFEVVIRAA